MVSECFLKIPGPERGTRVPWRYSIFNYQFRAHFTFKIIHCSNVTQEKDFMVNMNKGTYTRRNSERINNLVICGNKMISYSSGSHWDVTFRVEYLKYKTVVQKEWQPIKHYIEIPMQKWKYDRILKTARPF